MPDRETADIPRHIGFIVDGNRRWAKQHGIPTYEGHLAGHHALQEILPELVHQGVEYISLYLFSTENWNRTKDEVRRLMALITKVLTDDLKIFHEEEVRIRILGTRERLTKKVIDAIDKAEEETKDYTKATVAICFNYGGQLEIVEAFKKIAEEGIPAGDITEETVTQHLYAPDVPPIDMIVRTSGEQRLSNFMLWRAAYSELFFMDKMWPDMTKDDVTAIIKEYSRRHRRFGG